MSTENRTKEVDFYTYCRLCKYEGKAENDSPCWECLDQPYNINSRKPVEFVDGISDTPKRRKKW